MYNKKNEKYSHYTAEDFIQSNSFQNFVFSTNKQDTDFWGNWIKKNPHSKKDIQLASEYLRTQGTLHTEASVLDIQTELEKFLLTIDERAEPNPQKRNNLSPIRSYRKLAAVAVLSILASAMVAFFELNNSDIQMAVVEKEVELIEKTNPRGQKLIFQLPDGSKVKLNAEGKLRYPKQFNANERIVYLDGEAFFDVTRDENRPFKVITESVEVGVLGTSFAVNAYPGSSQEFITVETGKVRVTASNKQSVLILPDEMVVYNKMVSHMEKGVAEEKYLAWKNEELIFEKTGLEEMIGTLQRWYDVKIEVENVDRMDISINGRFQNQSLKNVLKGISYSSGFEYQINENIVKIVITK